MADYAVSCMGATLARAISYPTSSTCLMHGDNVRISVLYSSDHNQEALDGMGKE